MSKLQTFIEEATNQPVTDELAEVAASLLSFKETSDIDNLFAEEADILEEVAEVLKRRPPDPEALLSPKTNAEEEEEFNEETKEAEGFDTDEEEDEDLTPAEPTFRKVTQAIYDGPHSILDTGLGRDLADLERCRRLLDKELTRYYNGLVASITTKSQAAAAYHGYSAAAFQQFPLSNKALLSLVNDLERQLAKFGYELPASLVGLRNSI